MSSPELQDTKLGETEEKMTEASPSTDPNANKGTDNQEFSHNKTPRDSADSTKAAGDIKIIIDPPAIPTGTSKTESVLDPIKSDNFDDMKLCNEKDSGGDIDPRPITPTGSKNDVCDSPDFNLFNKTNNTLSLPRSITGTSTPATDSSEMLEEDIVLKWDDDEEEFEEKKSPVVLKWDDDDEEFQENKSAEQNTNRNNDMDDSETTIIEKIHEAEKSTNLGNVVEANVDVFVKKDNTLSLPRSITGTSTPATDSSKMLEEDMVLKWDDDDKEFEENKSAEQDTNRNNDMDNSETTIIEKIYEAEKSTNLGNVVESNVDVSVKKDCATEIKKAEESSIEKFHCVKVDQENKEEPENISIKNKITNLEKIIDNESANEQNQIKLIDPTTVASTKEPLAVKESKEFEGDNQIDIDKDTTSIDNIISNLDQMVDVDKDNPVINTESADSSFDTKTDQTQNKLSDTGEIELTTAKSITESENVDNIDDTPMDVDKVTTSISNIITNLDHLIDIDDTKVVKGNNDKTVTDEKEDSSLDANMDKEQVDFTDSLTINSDSDESFMDVREESNNKSNNDIQKNIDKITTCVENKNINQMIDQNKDKPIIVENVDSSIEINSDLNSVDNKMDTDNCNKTGPENEQNSEINDVMKENCADIIFSAKSKSISGKSSELDLSTSDSFLDVTLEEKEHNLIIPNMMTEIPSQSMIDFDESINLTHNESIDAKIQDNGVTKPHEKIAKIDGESQKTEDIPVETSNKIEISKTYVEIKDTKKQDSNENIEKQSQQTSAENKTELNAEVKETDSDEIETEVTKQVYSDKLVKEVSGKDKDNSLVETQDKTELITDPVTSSKTTDQTLDQTPQEDQPSNLVEPKTSSSQMDPDTSDEVPEVTDSLGLLAESSRVIEDDEEQETSDHDEGDDEEDFDQDDESSNQMTTEQDSNDSNTAQQSETDAQKDAPITQADVQTELDIETDNALDFIDKIGNADDVAEMETEDVKSESNIESEVADKDGDVDIEEDMVIDEVDIAATTEDGAGLLDQPLDALESAIKEAAEELEKVDAVVQPAKLEKSDIETVKLSDTSDAEEDAPKEKSSNILKTLLAASKENQSPSKTKKLEISKPKPALNFVDLEESSSEDEPPADVQEVAKEAVDDVTTVNIPSEIEIMAVGGNTSDIVTKEKEVVISGVPKPPPIKLARLNTSEVTIKTTTANEPTPSLVIPEVKGDKTKFGLEVFSLDSDEEESVPAKAPTPPPEPAAAPAPEPQKPPERRHKCINDACQSDPSVPQMAAPRAARALFAPHHNKRAQICERCAKAMVDRSESLVEGVRSLTPLLQLDMGSHRQELVEISDSDSEGEGDAEEEDTPPIGWRGAAMLEQLTDLINESWLKFRMDARLKEAEEALRIDQEEQEKELKELGTILDECQVATDKLRNELYATFEPEKKELPALVVFDTPDNMYSFVVPVSPVESEIEKTPSGQCKRRLSSVSDPPNKKFAIPLGFPPSEVKSDTATEPKTALSAPPAAQDDKNDDDKDISVVQLSAEAAPASLPPPGEPLRPRVQAGMQVFAMRNAFGSWLKAKVVECTPKGTAPSAAQFSQCRVKFESKTHKNAFKTLPARCLAYSAPSEVRMTIGTRIIALFKERDKEEPPKRESYYSGIVAEVPNPVNNFRYLVFFDDGYAQYVQHADTRLVCEFSSLVWEEVHPFSREFVRQYLLAYPERPMVRLHTGQSLKTEWNGKWWSCKVVGVDASLVHVHFEKDNRTEWIYRGSTRLAPLYLELQAAERHRARPLPRNRHANQTNMPYVEYTRSDEQTSPDKPPVNIHSHIEAQEELRRQRAVAKKSTTPAAPPAAPQPAPETVTSRVVYYTPKNAVKPYKMTPHTCSPKCKRSDVLSLKELRTYNPLAKPLLSGWERQIVRARGGAKAVAYRAPCGRRVRGERELHRYLRATRSDMGVDLFDFAPTTHCLAEFVLNKCTVSKKDLSNGKENVPVPCVNYYDDSLPEFCSYNTERTPTEGVPLNLDPEFLCGCDCTDDCEDKSRCACWQLTLEGARTIGLEGDVGYAYRRLPEPLPSGIYECNSRCKCKQTCLNRVAQHPLQLKLQVFKTINRGWGIRALNDVPKGAFLCVYAGNLLTDATANLDGLNEGDEYLAELDYIEVVEQMKEGYEEDIPEADKKLDKKESEDTSSSEESSDEDQSRSERNDGDFEPGYIGLGLQDFSKRLRKRDRSKRKEKGAPPAPGAAGEECITISDDEEVREPSRFAAQPGMGAEFVSKHRSVRSYFGKDEACYIMDAKVQGNIGRYLNHSCSPNVFVQNVFVDTHDPRFPWVAFFALRPVRAGTELTWNYNYDVGSVPGKVLYCHCGAANCRGRLL